MTKAPKYVMVIEQIKQWIETGEIKPGEKIYSENELAKMFDVSRHTVREAVGQLVHEGLLYREQGAGTFCSHEKKEIDANSTQVKGKNIGVITTYISDYIFPSIIRGMESHLSSKGYSLIISSTNNDIEKEKHCLEAMLNRNIDGLIVEPTKSSSYNPNIHYYLELEQRNIPYLMINQFYSELHPPYIMLNDERGGFLTTDFLITQGHEKIMGIFKADDLQGVYRMKGYMRAFREHGLPFFNEMILHYTTENMEAIIQEKINTLFSQTDQPPSAFVCYNDSVALFVINELRKRGIRIPEDVSIVGYDDSPLATATEVKLTSIAHPKMQMGVDAAKWMISAIEEKAYDRKSILYEPELIVRSSTRRIDSDLKSKDRADK